MKSNLLKSKRTLTLAGLVIGILLMAMPAVAADLLSLVPEKAVAVGMVDVDDLRSSPVTSRLFDDTDKVTTEGEARRFLEDAGLDPAKDIDRVMIAVSPDTDDSTEGEILVAAEGRFDVSRLSAVVAREGAIPQSAHGKTYFVLPNDEEGEDHRAGAVAFVSGSLSILGTEEAVTEALGALAQGGTDFRSASLIGRDLRLVDRSASAWMIMDVQRAARMKGGSDGVEIGGGHADQLGAALKHISTIAVWGGSGTDGLTFGGTALSADSETRQLLDDTVRGLLAMWRLAAQEEHPEWVPILRDFKVDQTADGVTLTGSIPASILEEHAKKIAANQ
jgi:hypothetical protein